MDIATCNTVNRVKLSSCYTSCLDGELSYLLHLYGYLNTYCLNVLLGLETIDLMATVPATRARLANMAIEE